MMQAVFLDHSGFLVELPSVTLLFDWWKGPLPPLRPDIPLLVFSSHWHEDHFTPDIFDLHADAFLLGEMSADWLRRKGVADAQIEKSISLSGFDTAAPLPGVTVETLPSTDEGVAFLVTADGTTVFHAGDLNWWHWAGEPDPWNPDMAAAFQQYCMPLRGRHIDLAMLPLDPRLKEDGFRGPRHFLTLAKIRRFLPMHQWGNFSFTDQFLACYPEFTEITVPVLKKGQRFEF